MNDTGKTRAQAFEAAIALVLLLGMASQAAAPSIASYGINDQRLRLSIQSELGVTNQIEHCADLQQGNWAVLTNLLVAQSPYFFEDAIVPGQARFYRVKVLYPPDNPGPAGMALIPAGPFTMGNCMDPDEGSPGELPLHIVSVSAFYMETNLVTYALWQQVFQWATEHGYAFSPTAAEGKATNHPVEYLNWYDALKWCNARSELEGRTPAYYTTSEHSTVYRTGMVDLDNACVNWEGGYRLPTEAEWEKAARGGLSGRRFPWGDLITQTNANYESVGSYPYDVSSTHLYHPAFYDGVTPYTGPVGYFAPNGYGLFDMAGNVDQWCWDAYDAYPATPQSDPRGPDPAMYRVFRGGTWNFGAYNCRVAFRASQCLAGVSSFNLGFRCVLPAGP